MIRLLQIITGDWVDPNAVVSVETTTKLANGKFLVYVVFTSGTHINVPVNTNEDAVRIRDDLADAINAQRACH